MIENFVLTFIVKICSCLMYTEVLSVVKISLEYSKYQILNHSGISVPDRGSSNHSGISVPDRGSKQNGSEPP